MQAWCKDLDLILALPWSLSEMELTYLKFICYGLRVLGWGKLVVGLSLSQFDSLVKVLSLLSSVRDFKHLLIVENLWDVFDHLEEFVLPKVL